jgi:outer membrane protein assembly factor BamB
MYATRASASLSTQANVAMSLFRNGPPPLPDGFTGLTVNNGSIYASSMNGYVYAFQASSGILLWKQNTGFANTSAPVVVDNTVYVGSGTIYALNATDGSVLWNYPTSDVGTSSPVIVNGVLYAGSNSDRVYALNAATGVLLWQYTTDGMVSVDPIVANGTVFFGSGDDGAALYAINAQNGKLLWHNSLLLVASSLAFSNNILYAGADNNLYGLSTHNGAILWHYQVSTPLNTLIAHGILYVASGSSGMNAFDTGNGERLWHNTLNPMHIGETTQPVLLGDEVYVATIDVGISPSTVFLHALNASTGVEDWSATVSWDISTIDVAA